MDSLLSQLNDDDAILLMYLADELPGADRVEVEQRLATDAALQQRLAALAAAHQAISKMMDELDHAARVPAAAGERAIGRLIAQWQTDRLHKRVAAALPQPGSLRMKWLIPLGAAAALFVGFVMWWSMQLDRGVANLDSLQMAAVPDELAIDAVETSFASYDELNEWQGLREADRQLDTVAFLRTLTE